MMIGTMFKFFSKEYDTEYNTELYYGIHATNWLTIRPNVQYVRHVGALKTQCPT